jgi:hypothetical protein
MSGRHLMMAGPLISGGGRFCASVAVSILIICTIRIYTRIKPKRDEKDSKRNGADDDDNIVIWKELPPHLQRQVYKQRKRQAKIPDLALKSNMYDNIEMVDPNGTLLANISKKKAEWYVSKRLATWKTGACCIQLSFAPRAHSGSGFEKSVKRNVCVACGDDGGLFMRHYIVPRAYRTLLAKKFKTHQSHDVVILCPDCHLHCEHATQLRMHSLEEELEEHCRHASFINQDLYRVKSAALALTKSRWNKHKLPCEKIQQYQTLVRNYLNISSHDDISQEQLQLAAAVEYRIPNPDYISGPQFVMQSLLLHDHQDDDEVEQFIKDWRRHFIDTVQPRFLPQGWSIDSPVMSTTRNRDDDDDNVKQ